MYPPRESTPPYEVHAPLQEILDLPLFKMNISSLWTFNCTVFGLHLSNCMVDCSAVVKAEEMSLQTVISVVIVEDKTEAW